MSKILLVEDDKNLSVEVTTYLRGRRMTVEPVFTLADAREYVLASQYDLVILDWNLPDGTGIELLREMRERGVSIAVLMLTNMDNIDSKETGFTAGADDYLTKPFHPKELVLRIESLLRRPSQMLQPELRAGVLSLDVTGRRVMLKGEELKLNPKEFALLEFLMRHPGQVFSAEALLARVWKTDSESGAETVVTTMARLRKKIGEENFPIKNIFGAGYKVELNGERTGTADNGAS